MRITTKMMTANVAGNLFKQSKQLLDIQKTIATERRINKASDDPVGMSNALRYRQALASIDQYRRNITSGKIRLELSENVLDAAQEMSNRAANIATDATSGTLDTRGVLATEVEGIHHQLLSLANTKLGNDYIYGGHQTDRMPFAHRLEIDGGAPGDIEFGLAVDATDLAIAIKDAGGATVRTISLGDGVTPGSGGGAGINSVAWNGLDDGGNPLADGTYSFTLAAGSNGEEVVSYETYKGDRGDIRVQIGENQGLVVNADGIETFSDIFFRLSQLQQGLQSSDSATGSTLIAAAAVPLVSAEEQLERVRAEGATRYKHLEMAATQFDRLKLRFEDMLEDTEKADITQAILELQQMETTYQTTLATAARILQPSLISFLG